MPYLRSLFLIFLPLFWLMDIHAQPLSLHFDHLGTEAGLSQSNVTCILQDSRGFMWFGTRDGLDRYDGYEFTVYKNTPGDRKSISDNFITAITKDKNGDLWIATWGGGICRYDRLKDRFIHYSTNSFTKFINDVMQDHQGNIWIGTNGGGVDVLDPKTSAVHNYAHDPRNPASLSDNDVKTIVEDDQHRIWLGTVNGGLNVCEPTHRGVFHSFRHDAADPNSLAADDIARIYEDQNHLLWIATQGGGLDLLREPTDAAPTNARTIFKHFRHDPNNPHSLSNNVLLSLSSDGDGNLWVGTDNGGLNILDLNKQRFQIYKQDEVDINSLDNNSVHSLYRDPEGNMWVGTYSGGINLYSQAIKQFRLYSHNSSPQSLSNNTILTIRQDRKKYLWIGTDGGGLDRLDRNTGIFTHFRHDAGNPKHSLSGDYVLAVHEDDNENLWVGTWGDGLTVMDKSRTSFRQFHHEAGNPASLSGDNVYAIAEDPEKNIWIGTYGNGLDRYDKKTHGFAHYNHDPEDPNSLSSDRVHALLVDSHGDLWVGTFDGGVDRYDKQTGNFIHYTHSAAKNSLSDNSINYLYEDHHRQLWICTSVGLNCLNLPSGHITTYYVRDGLPNDVIFGIQEDTHGHYWISTNNGMSMFDPVRGSFHNFSEADGLQANEFKAHACTTTSDGALYFGGVGGFNEFYPDSIRLQMREPPLVITRFEIFNKDVPIMDSATSQTTGQTTGQTAAEQKAARDRATARGNAAARTAAAQTIQSPLTRDITDTRNLILSYRSSVFTFEFASLDYTLKARKHYAYMLEGFDEKWNFIGTKRTATYTNLNPGHYTFRVRALNEDGSWLPTEASIRLTITPPFWRTWWFFGLAILAAVVIIWLAIKLRVRVIQTQKRVLEKQVQERTELLHQAMTEERHARTLAEKADQAKSDFLANMSHELRTPMNAIIGFSDLVLTTAMHEPERGYVQNVQRAGHNLLSIINDILDYSKIEAGKLIIDNVSFDPTTLVQETVDILALKAFEKGLELICDLDPNLPLQIQGDPVRWRQIIINLLGNAIKFTEKGEVVIVARKELVPKATSHPLIPSLDSEHTPQNLMITITDTGIGIPREKLDHIFLRFTQADSSTTRNYGGTGLGLTIAKHLAEMMGGSLKAESEPGKGSRFTVLLPLEVLEDQPAVVRHKRPGLGRLLVVDDNETNCRLMKALLAHIGIATELARDGAEALEAVARAHQQGRPFDLIITDHQMPGMDGITLVREIKTRWEQQQPQTHQTQLQHRPFILMLSSMDRTLHHQAAQHVGIDLFLSKPVKLHELDATLGSIFERRAIGPVAAAACATAPGVAAPAAIEIPPTNDHEEKPAEITPVQTAPTIIVAEDDPVNMLLISEVLTKMGCNVIKAANGREAVEQLETSTPAFILMDVNMPEMDGLEATRIIRENPGPKAKTPIIALTAAVMAKDRDRCLEAGMDDIITKPFRLEEIKTTLARFA